MWMNASSTVEVAHVIQVLVHVQTQMVEYNVHVNLAIKDLACLVHVPVSVIIYSYY